MGISSPFGKSLLILWLQSCGNQNETEQAVGHLGAPASCCLLLRQIPTPLLHLFHLQREGGQVVSADTRSSGLPWFDDRQGTGVENFPGGNACLALIL